MRLLHTADWHLGHSLHGLPRSYEHQRFLAWLLDTLVEERIDALVVAGDVFDTANPSAQAQQTYYRFLCDAKQRAPDLDIVVIGGNHDSASRLDAPRELLAALGPRVVGGLPRAEDGAIDAEQLLVELRGESGETEALCLALPYLRPADLPRDVEVAEGDDDLVVGMAELHRRLIDQACERLGAGQALIVTGHCYMTGSVLSELSERKILGGNQHALPVSIFGAAPAYVALGHLHKAQTVGEGERVRYAGSPIPLSFAEAGYSHEARLIVLDGKEMVQSEPRAVPRAVEMIRLGPAPLEEIGTALDALEPLPDDAVEAERPFLEVRVALDEPEPDLRAKVEDKLEGKLPRLTRLAGEHTGTDASLGQASSAESLAELDPEQVFRLCWEKKYEAEPPDEMVAAFHELLAEVEEAEP
ncbi:MAG: exonuclease SbcCD subunit D C-terminal domain-containing protein [Deltaproteobacteria bacterium]|nr:exonuclease SbcCD subunit D C-terminal domain-containing protein [Deltaproteobacteria bacterium]MBW2532293.1 exonuclease SbcCD subunit D C-terminal domain-containing protein [Deltaproteobacteria bacterium]